MLHVFHQSKWLGIPSAASRENREQQTARGRQMGQHENRKTLSNNWLELGLRLHNEQDTSTDEGPSVLSPISPQASNGAYFTCWGHRVSCTAPPKIAELLELFWSPRTFRSWSLDKQYDGIDSKDQAMGCSGPTKHLFCHFSG